MSAVVVTFRDEESETPQYYQFAWAWIVREYAERHSSKAPFLQWEQDGLLEFCETTIDMRQIEAVIRELAEAHYVREFRHDPAYANELSRRLEEDLGILAVPFRQTIMEYAKPVDDFEAAVSDGTLHHDGNPVYAWEIGHAKVKSDPNNNRRIIKPTDDDFRKVDIIQAGIMSLSGAVAAAAESSIYATVKPFYAGGDE
jgi:phage terminase large subunit-like protein